MPKAKDARTRILATTSDLFFSRGYELVGINEIIAKAGVAKASFYHHFKSKESLCAAWLKAERDLSLTANEELLAQGFSSAEVIRAKYDRLEKHLLKYDFRGCPFSNTKVMAPDSEEIATIIKEYKRSSLAFWIKLATQAGKNEITGTSLFLLFSGATSEAQNSQELDLIKQAEAASLELMT